MYVTPSTLPYVAVSKLPVHVHRYIYKQTREAPKSCWASEGTKCLKELSRGLKSFQCFFFLERNIICHVVCWMELKGHSSSTVRKLALIFWWPKLHSALQYVKCKLLRVGFTFANTVHQSVCVSVLLQHSSLFLHLKRYL